MGTYGHVVREIKVLFSLKHLVLQKEFCINEVLNEIYLQIFSRMGTTLRDESNDDN